MDEISEQAGRRQRAIVAAEPIDQTSVQPNIVGSRARVSGCSAASAFSPLPRVIFLLHRIEGVTHADMAFRLNITQAVVECCIAHVLSNIVRMREGQSPQPCVYANVEAAETILQSAFDDEQADWQYTKDEASRRVSRTLLAWGGKSEFDSWLWHKASGI